VGFIAEDVPDLVARKDRKSLSPMDIVAVLTAVTKEQKEKVAKEMSEKDSQIAEQKSEINALRDALAKQDERLLQLELSLAEIVRKQSSELQVGSTR
jgi:hypothetical protein